MALMYGRAGRLTAKNGGFRPPPPPVLARAGARRVAPRVGRAPPAVLPSVAARAALEQARPGPPRARAHCRSVLPLVHFIPDSLTYSVLLFLKRQCDRTLGLPPATRCAERPASACNVFGVFQTSVQWRFHPRLAFSRHAPRARFGYLQTASYARSDAPV
jgi:hypothetical protein